jgi:hypothetical protein
LDVGRLESASGLLASLKGLGELQTLKVDIKDNASATESVWVVCELMQLRNLCLKVPDAAGEMLLHLTQLKQLSSLDYKGLASLCIGAGQWTHQTTHLTFEVGPTVNTKHHRLQHVLGCG